MHPCETTFTYDSEKNLDKVLWDQLVSYRKYLGMYGNVYINDDYKNFFRSHLSSNTGISGENFTVFGKNITDRFHAITEPMHNIRQPSLCILGGEPNVDKFFFLQANLGMFDKTVLVGRLGSPIC